MKIRLVLFLVIIAVQVGCNNSTKNQKFPIILQKEPVQCGPVCLKMICQYYGKNVDLKELEKLSGMGISGTTLLGLSEVAESIGLKSLGVKISFEQLANEIPLPAIVYWNNNHYVVVYKIEKDSILVSDPAYGKIEYSKNEFCKSWLKSEIITSEEGIVLILEKTTDF